MTRREAGLAVLLRNVKVKAQIEKPLCREIVELTQQDSVLLTILGCGMADLVSPTTTTLVQPLGRTVPAFLDAAPLGVPHAL